MIRGMLRLNSESFLLLLDDLRRYPLAGLKAIAAFVKDVIECAMLTSGSDKKLNGLAKRAARGFGRVPGTGNIEWEGMCNVVFSLAPDACRRFDGHRCNYIEHRRAKVTGF